MRDKFLMTAFVILSIVNPNLLEAKTLQEVASEMGML